MPLKNVVVVAGVHGVSGKAAAEHWSAVPDTEVYSLSRRNAQPMAPTTRSSQQDFSNEEAA